jgi:hypothetical protein
MCSHRLPQAVPDQVSWPEELLSSEELLSREVFPSRRSYLKALIVNEYARNRLTSYESYHSIDYQNHFRVVKFEGH